MIIKIQSVEDAHPADLKPHPLANLFPMMEGEAFDDFASDIAANGQREPIVLFESQILDGRNRFKACQRLGVAPRLREYHGGDPLGYVISLNLKRRHLSESQRAMVAGKIANLGDGQRKDLRSANLPSSKTEALPVAPVSQPDAAKLLNVSERSVRTAKAVQKTGSPELIKAVEQGELSVSAAAFIAKQAPEVQAEILSPKDERKLVSAVKELKAAQDMHARVTAMPKPEPLSVEDQQSLAEALGTPDERGLVMTVLGIGQQVAELPPPVMFIDIVPPAYERTINEEIAALEAVSNWFGAFLNAWKAKE